MNTREEIDRGIDDGADADSESVVSKPELTLDEMIDLITDENRHEETDWGPPVGREVW